MRYTPRILSALLTFAIGVGAFTLWNRALPEPGSLPPVDDGPCTSEEDDIREAVFRYQFENNASAQQQRANFYFLSLDQRSDPSECLLARFRNHRPQVKKISEAGVDGGVWDRLTGKGGLRFHISTIKWVNDDEVEVEGGYYEGGLSSSGNRYTVERKNRRWFVTQDEMLWIS